MDKLKQQIQQRLIANIIIDKCARAEHLIFRDAWCTQERILRFTTPFFRAFFSVEENDEGKWKTGDFVMYEVNNGTSAFVVNCVLSCAAMSYDTLAKRDALLKALGIQTIGASEVVLKNWDLTRADGDLNKLFDDFDELLEKSIPRFEQELKEKLEEGESELTELHEGEEEHINFLKYERNPKARAACLAAHGAVCAVCGMDFEKNYGPQFAGIIEVHHIVPLSKIGKDYVVDPVKDLVPVCPNCHTALHSKKGGVYTIEELKKMRGER